jgi:hypothetical protein
MCGWSWNWICDWRGSTATYLVNCERKANSAQLGLELGLSLAIYSLLQNNNNTQKCNTFI